MKTSHLVLGLGGALVAFVVIRKYVMPPAKPTVGSASGQIIDGAKDIIDIFTRPSPPGVAPLAESPFAAVALGEGAYSDGPGYARDGFGMQPAAMNYQQARTAGVISGSHFRTN